MASMYQWIKQKKKKTIQPIEWKQEREKRKDISKIRKKRKGKQKKKTSIHNTGTIDIF